jgi:outer membrane protein assembly factor BamD (BamD/ComL family)
MTGRETAPTDKTRTARRYMTSAHTNAMEGQQERRRQAVYALLLAARTQAEIEAAYQAADRYLRQYPEDRHLIYAASQQTYARELELRRSGDWQD